MKLTKERAKELSIRKWEWIIENNGFVNNDRLIEELPELIDLAINENQDNEEYLKCLNEIKKYFESSSMFDEGDNRNSTVHGYMHPRFWSQESFEKLVIDVSKISKFSGF